MSTAMPERTYTSDAMRVLSKLARGFDNVLCDIAGDKIAKRGAPAPIDESDIADAAKAIVEAVDHSDADPAIKARMHSLFKFQLDARG